MRLGGSLNVLSGLLHLWLSWEFHRATHLSPDDRALMEMLNVVVTLLIFFFVYASFFRGKELLTTALGKAVLVLIVLMYVSRAIEEIILSPAFSIVILAMCLIVAGVCLAAILWKGEAAAWS
jgi:putative effector of murein hydrolase